MLTSPRRTLSPGVAYALAAVIIGLALFASGVPSPLYATYRELWGFSPLVLTLVYASYAFGVLAGVWRMPEPVAARSRPRLTPQRPYVPSAIRGPFVLAALGVISSWSIAGLFLSLGPQLTAQLFHTSNHVLAGVGIFALSGSGAVAQLAFGRTPPWAGAAGGSLALSAGMLLLVAAVAADSSLAFLLGAVIGGAGFGVAFLGALRALTAVIPAEHRAAVLAAFYVVAYAALSVPAIAGGVVVGALGLRPTFEVFGSAAAALALVVALYAARLRPASQRRLAFAEAR